MQTTKKEDSATILAQLRDLKTSIQARRKPTVKAIRKPTGRTTTARPAKMTTAQKIAAIKAQIDILRSDLIKMGKMDPPEEKKPNPLKLSAPTIAEVMSRHVKKT